MTDIHAEFTTADKCRVTLYPDNSGSTVMFLRVEHGHVAELKTEDGIKVQQAMVRFDPASLAALRAALIPDYSDTGVSKSDIKTALDETDHAAGLGAVQSRERRLAGFLREILDYYPRRDAREQPVSGKLYTSETLPDGVVITPESFGEQA